MKLSFRIVVAVRYFLVCDYFIVTPHKPSDVFLIPLSTGVLSELKIVTLFFVKSEEKYESHSFPIERRRAFLGLYIRGFVWLLMVTSREADVQKLLVEYWSCQGGELWGLWLLVLGSLNNGVL